MGIVRKKHKSILNYYFIAVFSLIVVIMLVSISGCGNKTTPETSAKKQPQQPVTPEIKPPVQEEIKQPPVTPEVTGDRQTPAVEYTIPEDKVTELKTRAMKTKAIFLVDAYPSGLSSGQSYVYAYGITNQGISAADFRFEVKFKNAKDMNNNPIDKVNEATLMSWFSNNKFEQVRLEKNDQATMPVGVTVGKEIAPSVSPVPGFYYFDFISKYNDGSIWKEYDKRPFSFRVK